MGRERTSAFPAEVFHCNLLHLSRKGSGGEYLNKCSEVSKASRRGASVLRPWPLPLPLGLLMGIKVKFTCRYIESHQASQSVGPRVVLPFALGQMWAKVIPFPLFPWVQLQKAETLKGHPRKRHIAYHAWKETAVLLPLPPLCRSSGRTAPSSSSLPLKNRCLPLDSSLSF